MAHRLRSSRHHLFGQRRWTRRRHYENLWPYADAWSATDTLASVDDTASTTSATAVLPSFFEGLAAYHRSHGSALQAMGPVAFESAVVAPLGRGGDVFFDDNAWLALALVRHFELQDDERALILATRLFEFITSGWSTDATWIHPGGIRWKQPLSNVSRNTCSNAPTAQLAALVHQHTGSAEALSWSVRIYDWVRTTLLGHAGLYVDRIDPDGALAPATWSYNQGTMIGAGVLLHSATGDRSYLADAIETAQASISAFGVPALVGQNAAFNAVYFRNLLLLDERQPDPRYRQLAAAYGDVMWEQHRHRHTGLFGGGDSPLNNTAPLIQIYALLAGAQPHA